MKSILFVTIMSLFYSVFVCSKPILEIPIDQSLPQNEGDSTTILPPATSLGVPAKGFASIQKFLLETIYLKGNTVLSDSDIFRITQPYIGREISISELHHLRYQLSKYYVDLGYINSGVVLPDQKVEQGTIYFQVIEGTLSQVNVKGNQRLSSSYIGQRIQRQIAEPLNVQQLQESLQLLRRNVRIEQLQAQLMPGDQPGGAVLEVDVTEASPYRLSLYVDNYRSPSVGTPHLGLHLQHNNLMGWGDELTLSGTDSRGLREAYIRYAVPVSVNNAQISLSYSSSNSLIIEEPFDSIDINSNSYAASISYRHPLKNHLLEQTHFFIGFDKHHSASTLLGQPYDFSLGMVNGEVTTTALHLGAEWITRSQRHVLALRGTYYRGLDIGGATIHAKNIPDGRYQKLIGQLQWIHQSGAPVLAGEWRINASFQFTEDPLLSVEKFSIGGANTVRGYRENQWVRDRGLSIKFGYHLPLFKDAFGQSRYGLTLIPFIDYGRSWNKNVTINGLSLIDDKAESISSLGLGLQWKPKPWLDAELFYGYALDSVPEPHTKEWQDRGIHFSLRLHLLH